jgi:succinyl-CoA synthetase alpha subunit
VAILVRKETRTLVQGLTGKEGLKAAISMRDYGTPVSAGVTPNKGGQVVEGFPVYNTVSEAKAAHPEINASVLYVPAKAVLGAALEAMNAGIPLITIVTEHVPVKDTALLVAEARARPSAREGPVRIVGPSSIGIIAPGVGKIGSIGGFTPSRSFSAGPVGIISKSGGMCSEIAHMLSHAGLGQSTVVGLGGDRIAGTTFADLLALFQADPDTRLVVLYGEIGGTYEQEAAGLVSSGGFTKPLVVCISGRFAETLPHGVHLGHAGAIIEGSEGTRAAKVEAFRRANGSVAVAESSDEIPALCKHLLDRER